MGKCLYIDLEKCNRCKECKAACSYFYHPGNNGVTSLREVTTFALLCKQCEEGTCVKACPKEALEKQADGILKRYNLRCVGCKTCILACPFGNIHPDVIPYLVSKCDFCAGKNEIECVKSCTENAIRIMDIEKPDKDVYLVGENLAIRYIAWKKA